MSSHWYAHFTSDGIGVEDLEDVRIYIKRNDEDSYAVEGELCSSKGDGIYIFKQENPTIGKYWAVFKTAGTSVDQKEMATTEYV